MYKPLTLCSTETLRIRNHPYRVLIWGDPRRQYAQKPLVLLHGWMDVAASFQFMVDALSAQRLILAPDWRGFGASQHTPQMHGAESAHHQVDHYVFADYLADLSFLLDHYFPSDSVNLLGHSMGGNVAMLYAGIFPTKVHKLINLEGFGLARTQAAQAPQHYRKWIDQLKRFHQGAINLRPYKSLDAVAERLMKTNPRITTDKALWLAGHWAQEGANGEWHIMGDAAHKVTSAQLYRSDEAQEIYRLISAPVLCVTAQEDSLRKWWPTQYTQQEFFERMRVIENFTHHQLMDCGHMLHHDQPVALAALIDAFLSDT